MLKLRKPPINFGLQLVNNTRSAIWTKGYYFQKLNHKVFKILKKIDESKAPGIDDLSEIFPKDGASLLATSRTAMQYVNFFW